MRRIAWAVLVGLVGALLLGGCSSGTTVSRGDCVRQQPGTDGRNLPKVACDAPDALYRVESTDRGCPAGDYLSRSYRSGTRTNRVCLYLDLRQGQCITLWDARRGVTDPVRSACSPGAERVVQRLDNVFDRHRCPSGTDLIKTYSGSTEFTLCLGKVT